MKRRGPKTEPWGVRDVCVDFFVSDGLVMARAETNMNRIGKDLNLHREQCQ